MVQTMLMEYITSKKIIADQFISDYSKQITQHEKVSILKVSHNTNLEIFSNNTLEITKVLKLLMEFGKFDLKVKQTFEAT